MNAVKVYSQPMQYNRSNASISNAREYAKAQIRKQRRRKLLRKRVMKVMLVAVVAGLSVLSFSSLFLDSESNYTNFLPEQNKSIQQYTGEAYILETADQLLNEIIKDGMSKEQKVHAVYAWLRMNCSYGGHGDRSDYLQAAYSMMTNRKGDCYSYFAVSKLLFDRMGIDNIDVKKVKNNPKDSNHYWNMVSLDDGETWYHFDATPRVGDGDDFCLVTDAFIDAYSKAHDNSHNRDKSLYPATPVN